MSLPARPRRPPLSDVMIAVRSLMRLLSDSGCNEFIWHNGFVPQRVGGSAGLKPREIYLHNINIVSEPPRAWGRRVLHVCARVWMFLQCWAHVVDHRNHWGLLWKPNCVREAEPISLEVAWKRVQKASRIFARTQVAFRMFGLRRRRRRSGVSAAYVRYVCFMFGIRLFLVLSAAGLS